MFSAKYGLNGPIKRIYIVISQLMRFLKFAFSDHSFTRLAAARWQDSMSRGQKSSNFLNFPHSMIFCSFLDKVEIIVSEIYF